MLTKEYRVAMPFTIEEYHIGQLYMIAKHSHEQSESGEGVEVIHNVPHSDDKHGEGRYTEKRIHLSHRLPYFLQAISPRFYVTEKSWNFYPYTETEYTCSFIPKFNIFIKTRYENNNGSNDNCLGLTPEELELRVVDEIDIAYDELLPKHYKAVEDPKLFKSEKTGRGPLKEAWKNSFQPIMCSYKLVQVTFEVWGLQTKVENYAHSAIRDILLLGHRQAFAWIDEWYGKNEQDVREYELQMQAKTNIKVLGENEAAGEDGGEEKFEEAKEAIDEEEDVEEKDKDKEKKEAKSEEKAEGASGNTEAEVQQQPSAVASTISGLKSWLWS